MTERDHAGDSISASIKGHVSGQAAVGKDISQAQTPGLTPRALSAADRAELWGAIAELQARIGSDAPAHKRDDALAQVSELETAVAGSEPDVSAVDRVKNWFIENLPTLAGAVTQILIKVTEAR